MHLYLISFFTTLAIGVLTSFSFWANDYLSLDLEITKTTISSDCKTFEQSRQIEPIPINKANTCEENETYEKVYKKNTAHQANTYVNLNFKNSFGPSLHYTKSNFNTLKRVPLFVLFSCWKFDII